jgi:hypothetical protein
MDQAMRTALLALPIFVSAFLNAQSWCPPGAQWNYQIQGLMLDGCVVRTYVGDTVIDGWNAQRIHESGFRIEYWSGDTVALDSDRYTSIQGSTLFLWGAFSDPVGWDTLHRFDATIGDRWFPPHADSVCLDGYASMLEVMDTSSLVIDGYMLRRWTMTYLDALGQPTWNFDVLERLGPLTGLEILPGGCIIIEYGEVLSCYTDQEISYNDAYWPYGCASVLGLRQDPPEPGISLSPNPGTDHFTMQSPPGPNTITMHDALGRSVLVQRTTGGNVEVDTSDLPPGTYFVRTTTAYGSATHAKWIKQ